MNTYLIVSETNYFINEKLKELKGNIDNIITFNMDENTIDEVLEEASYFSMFDDKKCIIVKNAKIFASAKKGDSNKAKSDTDKLLKYLESENKNTKLVFIINKADSKKKIYNKLKENNNVFLYSSLTKTDMKNKLKEIVNSRNYQIDDNSLWYIINNSLNNFDLAVNEINKIFLYYGNACNIKYEDVLHLTAKTIEENNFKKIKSRANNYISVNL